MRVKGLTANNLKYIRRSSGASLTAARHSSNFTRVKTCALPSMLCFAVLLMTAAACRQPLPSAADIQLHITVDDRQVGETTLRVTATDTEGNSIENPGALSIRGDMSHAGMTPVFAEADQAVDGVFILPFEWTMGGEWIVEASLTLASGEVYQQTFNYEIMSEARHAMPGETSALYMRIANRGARAITIRSAETSVAHRAEFHETIVENDVARMETLEGLVIPAGETLELRPAGKHIMLSQLTQDIAPHSTVNVRLILDSGEPLDIAAVVLDMRMDELDDRVEFGELAFSQIWLRPAAGMGP